MKRWLWLGLLVFIVGGAIIWRVVQKQAAAAQLQRQQQFRRAASGNVVVAVAKPGDILQTLSAVGNLTTPYDEKLASKVAGIVNSLEVRPGDNVKAGQILVRIDPSQAQANVAQQRSNVAQARSRYAQALLTESPTNVGVTTAILQQQAGVASSQANFNQVQQNYNATVAAAQSAVTDAQARVSTATANVNSAQSDVNSAVANVNNAQAKYSRMLSLYQQGFAAAQDVDDARTTLQVQEAAHQSALQKLNGARSALNSAQAQRDAAAQQLSITKKKGAADIVSAKAQLNQAKASLNLASTNRAQVPAYKENLAALRAAIDAANSQLALAIAQLGDTTLKSSVSGTVTNRFIDPGSTATAGQELLEVQYLDSLYVTASAPIESAGSIVPGQDAQLTVDAFPGRTFHATISNVSQAADPTSRQFIFQMKLPNPGHLLKPGMFAHVTTVTSRIYAKVLVPHEAVTQSQKGTTVTIIDEQNVAHIVPVKVGASDAANVQILEGVNPGDKVVILSYQPIKDGAKVTPNEGRPGRGGGPSVQASGTAGGGGGGFPGTPNGSQGGGGGR